MNHKLLSIAGLSVLLFASSCKHSDEPEQNSDNKAIVMNGSNTRLSVPVSDDLKLVNGSFTIEAWATAQPDSYFQTIVEKRTYPSRGDYWIGLDRTGVWRMTIGNYDADLYTTEPVVAGRKYHVAGTFDHETGIAKLYVDGVLSASGVVRDPELLVSTNEPLYIGASKTETIRDENLNGKLDEVRIWSVARTQTEIAATMKTKLSAGASGLVAYWNFDQGAGATVADQSGNGHTARVDVAPQWVNSPFDVR